jgi:histidyl-tRNA synthetase
MSFIQRPRGTSDKLLSSNPEIKILQAQFDLIMQIFNYSEIVTPTFEFENLFTAAIDENSELISKEMYSFLDKKGRKLALRPEGTASAIRAFIENE